MDEPATRKREVAARREGMARFGTKEGIIVAMDEEDELACEEGIVRIALARRWFMGGFEG